MEVSTQDICFDFLHQHRTFPLIVPADYFSPQGFWFLREVSSLAKNLSTVALMLQHGFFSGQYTSLPREAGWVNLLRNSVIEVSWRTIPEIGNPIAE